MIASNHSAYSLKERILGPKVTRDDILLLRTRADMEGWRDWFDQICSIHNKRKRKWFVAYLRDGLITIEVHEIRLVEDDDPYEGMG